ncbi:MAG TPA: carboxypeptidase regulatory-like domain-containing protein [Gemmatimonadaceae bacterium]|nr:carboxypeptidase regulatory-like domain-containing protein [Gemmatimonadaceae bacterium]
MSKRLLLLTSAIAALVSSSARAQNPSSAPAAAPAGFASIHGTVLDSLHDALLSHALVRVENTTREALTDANGAYRIDSVPTGMQRLVVIHPLLDTLGIALVTPPITFNAGEIRAFDLSIPSGETLVSLFCTAAQRSMGPAALVGFVRDADSEGAAEGAKASLLYYESDPLGFKKTPKVRERPIGKDGHYRICGLPATMSGKLQVFRNGVQTGEVPVDIGGTSGTQLLAMRSMSIASNSVVASAGTSDSGKQITIVRGKSRVTGKVLNKYGQPIAGARVELQNTGAATKTRADGGFTLDSLPSGTQTLEIRQLGFSPTEVPVELSQASPQSVTVKMGEYVPVLSTMRVTAQKERGLSDVGFADRKRSGMGYYLDEDQLKMRQSTQFSDMLRTVPGIRVQPAGDGTNVITSSRNPTGGCVMFYVDGSPWQQMTPGDLDTYVRPEEVAALEVYNGSTTPPQFVQPGNGGCTTVVIWTVRRINRKKDQ